MEIASAAALATLDARFAWHDSASRPRTRIGSSRLAEPARNNLVFVLAYDRVTSYSQRRVVEAESPPSDEHRGDGLESHGLVDEPLTVVLAEWR